MNRFSFSVSRSVFGLLVAIASSFVGAKAHAVAPGNQVLELEMCVSQDGKHRLLKNFGETGAYYVFVDEKTTKPEVKENYTYTRDASGRTVTQQVDFEMFAMMVEPFGEFTLPRSQWVAASQTRYEGKISIVDDLSKPLATVEMSCDSATLEYKP